MITKITLPTIDNLPSPAPGKMGWPWTEANPMLPDTMSDGSPWPRLSIVTPSYNQGQFLEETIRSVLLQGYPNLEYIIIDGNSTDGSVEIIKRYEPWLAYWVSEPDQGQSDALNKGFQRATGSIVAWINSDDNYLPGVFAERVLELVKDSGLVMVYGDCHRVDEAGERINTWKTNQVTASSLLLDGNQIPQQSTFLRATILNAIGGLDPELNYVMDYALWLRLSQLGELKYTPGLVANFRKHRASKGLSAGFAFWEEWLNWLTKWNGLGRILSESEQSEVFRRQHIVAAINAIFEKKEALAVAHFNLALSDGIWPYGDVNILAQKIVDFAGMSGQTMKDSWGRYEALRNVLHFAQPAVMSQQLHWRIASQYHVWAAHAFNINNMNSVRAHLIKGFWYDPRQLRSRIFQYHATYAFLDRRVASWLRWLVKKFEGENAG